MVFDESRAGPRRRLVTLGTAILLAWAATPARAEPLQPDIHRAPCPASSADSISAVQPACGWLTGIGRLDGHAVRLRVVRLPAHPGQTGRRPVVFVPGGPGDPAGLTRRGLRGWLGFQQRAGWPRDLVLYDPRSTGQSRPRIVCPKTAESLIACRKSLGATAHGLSTATQVADLHHLISALDAGPVVLWARSFGAAIALRLAGRHPRQVAGLVLESPMLWPESPASQTRRAMRAAVARRIADCRRDIACRLGVPAAADLLAGWLGALASRPMTLTHATPPRRARRLRVDARDLLAGLLLHDYGRADKNAVVSRLRRALTERGALWPLVAPLAVLRDRSPERAPVYWSARCSIATIGRVPLSDLARRPIDLASYLPPARSPCRDWPIMRDHAVTPPADIRGLVVSGRDDAITPAFVTRAFVARYPAMGRVIVDGAGHGVVTDSACARRTIARWLREPSSYRPITRHCPPAE